MILLICSGFFYIYMYHTTPLNAPTRTVLTLLLCTFLFRFGLEIVLFSLGLIMEFTVLFPHWTAVRGRQLPRLQLHAQTENSARRPMKTRGNDSFVRTLEQREGKWQNPSKTSRRGIELRRRTIKRMNLNAKPSTPLLILPKLLILRLIPTQIPPNPPPQQNISHPPRAEREIHQHHIR